MRDWQARNPARARVGFRTRISTLKFKPASRPATQTRTPVPYFDSDPCLTQLRNRDLNTCLAGEEPSHCTAAQRAWVYSHDPVIKYHEEGVPVAPPAEGLSVTIEASPKNIG